MSEPTHDEPVVINAPASEASGENAPTGQIEHPAVPTPADAIDHEPDATPAVADAGDVEAQPGHPSSLLPPGAYFEI